MADRDRGTLAQRKRQVVVDELTEAALQLMAVRGFDETTIDDIVVAAGVSRRTFFRYFSSKEDVAVQLLADLGADMATELAARPAGEPPSIALRHAVDVAINHCTGRPEKVLPVIGLILRTPVLTARYLEQNERWRDDLARVLRGDEAGDEAGDDLWARLAAGMALDAFRTVLQRWNEAGGAGDLAELTGRAFALLAPALDVRGQHRSG